jgi:HEPN domain-containing protein
MTQRHHGITDQTKAAVHRLQDARALLATQRYRGAMYMAGYALECALKAKLMRVHACRHLAELEKLLHDRGMMPGHQSVHTHSLEQLFLLTSSLPRLAGNRPVLQSLAVANQWIPAWRYSGQPANQRQAERFVDSIATLVQWVEHNI